MTKLKLLMHLPTIVKASAYILMGVGAMANVVGYDAVGNSLLAVASVLGLKEATNEVQQ